VFGERLSPEVDAAVDVAVDAILTLLSPRPMRAA
jgi:Ni,Fe-hydrogenase maturation factor